MENKAFKYCINQYELIICQESESKNLSPDIIYYYIIEKVIRNFSSICAYQLEKILCIDSHQAYKILICLEDLELISANNTKAAYIWDSTEENTHYKIDRSNCTEIAPIFECLTRVIEDSKNNDENFFDLDL